MKKLKEGDRVTFVTKHKKEHGIVKAVVDEDEVFVVFNCGGDWVNYFNYTAALTLTKNLVKDWV